MPDQNINIDGQLRSVSIEQVGVSGKRVAVIGAGPSGLICGLVLNKLGYHVDVFEQNDVIGGKISQGIPEFRLPRSVITKELSDIADRLSVHFGKALGRDFTLNHLFNEGFEAVYIAPGKWKAKMLDIPGMKLDGVYDFESILFNDAWQGKSYKNAAVIGAGNVAMDTARVLKKGGLEEVHIFFIGSNQEITAWQDEREEAWQDGVVFHMLAIPEIIEGTNGTVRGIKFSRSQVQNQGNGMWNVKALDDAFDFNYPLDMVVMAIGSETDQEVLAEQNLILDSLGQIVVNGDLATNIPRVFAGGDAIGMGRGTVVQAVADGKRAAINIHNYLLGRQDNGN